MASSSSSSLSSPQMKYQVFLSFRGEDTRHNFTSHLRKALKDIGLNVFFDEEKLERGEQLSSQLSEAIASSTISIIVLSKNYASSKSCLAELYDIVAANRTQGHIVLPIFYLVNPSDVRNHSGSFKISLDVHESNGVHRVQQWKKALADVGKLKGWHIEGVNCHRSETDYIREIVAYVIMKLNSKSRSVSQGLVGIDEQKKELLSMIERGENRVIGLWGMGGIGKTTLAEFVYKEISPMFEALCFVENVREKIEKQGKKSLRDELLSKLLKSEICIDTPSIESTLTQQRLENIRVLVVLDDVDQSDQIEYFSVKHFVNGSKIILTSRDRQVLDVGGADKIHEVKKLSDNESLQLFSTFAFKHLNPPVEFRDLSYMFLAYYQTKSYKQLISFPARVDGTRKLRPF